MLVQQVVCVKGVIFTASLRLCNAGVHGGKDGLAGHGGAGDGVHTGGGAGLCQLRCQRLGGLAAQVRGLSRGVHLYGSHLAAGHSDRDGHFTQAALCRGGVAAIGQGGGVVGGGYGASVVDLQVQHNAHQHGGCQHEQNITGHFRGHGMVSSPWG